MAERLLLGARLDAERLVERLCEPIRIRRYERASDAEARDIRVRDLELAQIVAIDLLDHVAQLLALEHQSAFGPGELARYVRKMNRCCFHAAISHRGDSACRVCLR